MPADREPRWHRGRHTLTCPRIAPPIMSSMGQDALDHRQPATYMHTSPAARDFPQGQRRSEGFASVAARLSLKRRRNATSLQLARFEETVQVAREIRTASSHIVPVGSGQGLQPLQRRPSGAEGRDAGTAPKPPVLCDLTRTIHVTLYSWASGQWIECEASSPGCWRSGKFGMMGL